MKCKKTILIFKFSIMLSLISLVVHALPVSSNEITDAALKKFFPRLKYKTISKTDIDGLYEINTGEKIIYFFPKKGYIFVGEIISKDGRNITLERKEEEKYKMLTDEDLRKAIKVGTGKNIVVEVTDPECPFCRKMHAYWSMRHDVTRYIFFKPLDIHPDARLLATYILASSDPIKAMFEVYCGSLDDKKSIIGKKYDDKGKLAAQEEVADKLQVTATPSYWVNGKFVSGANIPLIESIIGKSGQSAPNVQDGADSNCGG